MDIRLVIAAAVVILSVVGFLILTLSGYADEGEKILTLVGLPALTFVLGLGSDLKTDD